MWTGAEEKQAVYVWDIRSGRIRHSLTAHGAKVTDVACSPMDPDVAASCAADRTIKVRSLGRYINNVYVVIGVETIVVLNLGRNIFKLKKQLKYKH